MDTQSVLMLVVAAVLVALGASQMSSRRLNRARKQRNRTGMLLIIIGFVIGLIVLVTRVGQ